MTVGELMKVVSPDTKWVTLFYHNRCIFIQGTFSAICRNKDLLNLHIVSVSFNEKEESLYINADGPRGGGVNGE